MRTRKTLSNWLYNRYLLIIRNEENFAEKTSLSFTYAKVIVFTVLILTVVFVLSLFMAQTILAQWFDPRHTQIEFNRKLIELSIKVDSLEEQVMLKQQFIDNFQTILTGESIRGEEFFDEQENQTEVRLQQNQGSDNLQVIDSLFREDFESGDESLISLNRADYNELQEIFFFPPIEGIISSTYNVKEGHYGVDIVTKKNEPVKCVADGTVIFSSWTQDSGYVLAVQHRSNLISVYKHNAQLLKKVANFVNAGEIIAIVGNTGELTDGPHLHFELWFNGNPVNPEEFIVF